MYAAGMGAQSSEAAQPLAAVALPERMASHAEASTSSSAADKLVNLQQAGVTAKLLLAGGLAGVVSKSATAPLSRVTILYQVEGYGSSRPPSIRAAFSQVIAKQGFTGLWRGNGVTIIHRMPYSAINFYAYERFTQVLNNVMPEADSEAQQERLDVARRLVAGGAAGSIAAALTYPLDLIRTQMAADLRSTAPHGTSMYRLLAGIVASDGVRGLYQGLGATLLQVAPNLAINYSVYETMRSRWMAANPELDSPTMAMSLSCGSFAGLVSSSLTFPLDVVRRHMQVASGAGRPAPSYADVIGHVLRKKGVRGFYAGLVPEYCKVVPGVAIAFSAYEASKWLMGVSGANAGAR